jgi:hypothetical protein
MLLGEIEWRSLNVGSFVIRYPRAEKAAERAKKIHASKRVRSALKRGATICLGSRHERATTTHRIDPAAQDVVNARDDSLVTNAYA